MSSNNLIASARSIKGSLIASKSVLSAKRKTLKSRIIKSLIFAVAVFFAFAYLLASSSGYLSYLISIDPSVEYNEPLRAIFGQMSEGNNIVFGSVAVISLLSYVFFAPLIGTATLSLLSEDESLSLSLPRGHKFFDALFLNLFSGVGFLQLLIGTGVVSILSIEGSRLIPILAFFLIWLLAGTLSTTLGWVREYVIQKIGFVKTLVLSIGILASVSLVFSLLLLTPFAEAYTGFVVWIATLGSLSKIFLLFLGLISFIVVLAALGHRLAQRVLVASFPREGKKVSQKNSFLAGRASPFVQGLLLVNLTVFRTRESRRTIIVVSILAVLAIIFAPLDSTSLSGLVIGVIATFSLAWLVNLYGLLGSGNIFLATNPKIYQTLPVAAFLYGTLVPLAFLVAILTTGLALGSFELEAYFSYLIMSALLSPLNALFASLIAIYKPYRSRLEGRGDVLVPPLASLAYLAIFIALGSSISLIASRMLFNYQSALLAIATGGLIVFVGRVLILYYWNADNTQYKIMKMSNGD